MYVSCSVNFQIDPEQLYKPYMLIICSVTTTMACKTLDIISRIKSLIAT